MALEELTPPFPSYLNSYMACMELVDQINILSCSNEDCKDAPNGLAMDDYTILLSIKNDELLHSLVQTHVMGHIYTFWVKVIKTILKYQDKHIYFQF